jgi:hypothetical protein
MPRMYFEIDLTSVPPIVALREPDDFKSFKVVLRGEDHAHVDPEEIARFAAPRSEDPAWQEGMAKMLAFAADHGWVRDDGAVRAHVEWPERS